MPLVPAKCTSCGATLTLNPAQDAAVCPFCNTPFIVEKAINNYTTVNHYHTTQNITAKTVIMQNSRQEELYQAAESLVKLGDTLSATAKFKEMVQEFPGDWRGWWGRYKLSMQQTKAIYYTSWEYGDPIFPLENALQTAPPSESKKLRKLAQDDVAELLRRVDHATTRLAVLKQKWAQEYQNLQEHIAACKELNEYEAAKAHYAALENAVQEKEYALSSHSEKLSEIFFSKAFGHPLDPRAAKEYEKTNAALESYSFKLNDARDRYAARRKALEDETYERAAPLLNEIKDCENTISIFTPLINQFEKVLTK